MIIIITKKELKEVKDEERRQVRYELSQKVSALFKEDKPSNSLAQTYALLDYNEAILDVLAMIRKLGD